MEVITKADGTPTKSRVFAVNFLKNKGIDESCLIEKEGKFYYEVKETVDKVTDKVTDHIADASKKVEPVTECNQLNWDTPAFYDGDNNTELKIKSADVDVKIIAKHPAGQTLTRPYNAFELQIGSEHFIMSENLCTQIFEVNGV